MSELLGSLLRFVLKLLLTLMALVFAVSLLLAALLTAAFIVVKALLTGKKRAPAMVFNRFRHYSPQDMWRQNPSSAASSSPSSQIVDVQVRDITTDSCSAERTEATATLPAKTDDDIIDVLQKKRP